MKTCKYFRNQFVDALYQQMEPEQLKDFEKHLQECAACRAEFKQLQNTGDLLELKQRLEPEADFWKNFENRVLEQVEIPSKSPKQNWFPQFEWERLFSGWRLQLAGGLAMLVLGIFIGYLFFGGPYREQQQYLVESQQTALQARVVQTQALDYIERSKILLLGLVNLDADQTALSEINFTHQKKISRELIQEAAQLKPQLAGSENLQLQELIGKLEMILLQIANYEKQFDLPAVSLISSGIENQALFLKINIEEMRLTTQLQQSQAEQSQKQQIQL